MAFKMKIGGKRKRAKASAKSQVSAASKLGMSLDERKLFKQELKIQKDLAKRTRKNK